MSGTLQVESVSSFEYIMDIFHVILSTDNIIHVEYVIHRLSLLISDAESPTLVPVYVEPLGD